MKTNLLLIASLCVFGCSASAQQSVVARIEPSGSVPEVPGLYDCVRQLEKGPYSRDEADACLRSIAKTKFFDSAEIRTRPLDGNRVELTFELSSPSAIVQELKITPTGSDANEIVEWFGRNPRRLQIGSPYTSVQEVSTRAGIERFYATRGYHAGVSSTVILDYASRSAKIEFHVTKGPEMSPEPLIPPYGDVCEDQVGTLDWTGVGQEVPLPLVRNMTKLHDIGSCFSIDTLNADQRLLETSGLFTNVVITYQGAPTYRQVSVTLNSKPIAIDKVEVKRIGVNGEVGFRQESDFPLKAGDVYQSSKAADCVKTLEAIFKSPEQRVAVFERDALTERNHLIVSFEVLIFPENRLFINGSLVFPKTTAN